MDWSQILYVALGAGLGAGLGSVIAFVVNKKIANEKYHGAIVAAFSVLLMSVGSLYAQNLYENMKLPRLGVSLEQQILDASPIYVEMKKSEPEYFDKILSQLDVSARKGTDETAMINEARAVLIQLMADKTKYADVDTLTTMFEISQQNYIDFKANKPYLCTQSLNQRGLGNIMPYVSEASVKLEEEYALKMIRLPKVKPAVVDVAMAEKSQQDMVQAFQKFLQSGENMDPPPNAPLSELERVCDIGLKSVELILEMPEAERANYIRNTLGQ